MKIAPNMPTEETFTSPHAAGTNGTFTCTFPLSFQGRLIEGLRGEFRDGKLVRLDASKKKDRDFVAAYIDSDPKGNGRRLGEVALVDSTSRIGQSGRTYFHTLLDENAAAHIAFGAGFGGTRTGEARGRAEPRDRAPRRDDRRPRLRGDRHHGERASAFP